MKKENKYKLCSECIYYYGLSKNLHHTFRMALEFKEDIKLDSLKKALEITQKRYPYFSIRRKQNLRNIYLIHNDLPWVIKEKSDNKVILGNKDTNFHMITFSYKNKWLYIDVFHGLTDATGLMELIRTLLFYYVKNAYDPNVKSKNIRLIEDEIDIEEVIDPYLKLKKREKEKRYRLYREPYLYLNDENKFEIKGPYIYRVEIPQKELMDYCKEFDGSPATAISLFLARAIKEIHPNSNRIIGAGIVTNLREALGVKKSHQSTDALPVLEFTDKIASKSLEIQGTAFRGQVLLKCKKDGLIDEVYDNKKFFDFMNKLHFKGLKNFLIHFIISKYMKTCTFNVSYVGRCQFEETEKYINQFYTEPCVTGMGLMIEMNCLNDKFYLTFLQEWVESIYFDIFLKKLKECNISYKVIDNFKQEIVETERRIK